MNLDDSRARIGYRDSALSRARNLASKAFIVLGGAVMLAGAFAISLVFLVIALAVVLTFGGYLWWKTRALRRQIRDGIQPKSGYAGRVIEGEVISQERIGR